MPRKVVQHFPYSLLSDGTSTNRLNILDSEVAPAELQTIGSDGGSYSVMVRFKTVDQNTGITAWMSQATLFGWRQQAGTSAKAPFNIGIVSNKLSFGRTQSSSSGDEVFSSAQSINDGKWHWVLCTVNDLTLKIFIDGSLDSTNTFTVPTGDCSVGTVINNLSWLSRTTDGGAFQNSAEAYMVEAAIWEEDLSDAAADLYARVTDLTGSTGAYNQTMADSLKGHWKATEGSGATVADSSAFSNDGTITGLTWEGDSPMKQRSAVQNIPYSLDITGTNGAEINMGDNLDKEWNESFSWSTRLFIRDDTNIQGIISKRLFSSPFTGWNIQPNGGKIKLSLRGTTSTSNIDIGTLSSYPLNRWFDFVMTWDGSGLASGFKIYFDAVLQPMNTAVSDDFDNTSSLNSEDLIFGEGGVSGANPLDGLMADTRLHSVELTQAQIDAAHYGNQHVFVEAYWPGTEGSGSTLAETIGGIDGTITTATWSTNTPSKPRKVVQNFLYSLQSDGTATNRANILDTETAPTELQTIGSDGGSYSVLVRFNTVDTNSTLNAWMSLATLFDFRTQAGSSARAPFSIGVMSGALLFGRTQGGATEDQTFSSTKNINDGKWRWALCTVNDVTLKIFIDGSLDSLHTFTIPIGDCSVGTTNSNMNILSRATDAGAFQDSAEAYVAEAAVWEEDLSDAAGELFRNVTNLEAASGAYTSTMVSALKGHWKPSEGSGSTVADSSSFSNDATITGLTWSGNSPSKLRASISPFTQSADFSDNNDRIDGMTTYSPSGGFTLYTVVKFNTVTGTKTWYAQEDGTGTGRSWLRITTSGLISFSLGGGSKSFNYTVVADTWYKITTVYDPTALTYSLYVDGHFVEAISITAASPTGTHVIGENKTGSNDFNGLIAAVSLHTTAHDSFTVKDVQRTNIYPTNDAEYTFIFADSIGPTITDSSGNGNDGTNTGVTASTDTPNIARTVIT